MGHISDAPARIFDTKSDAESVIVQLAKGELDGWTYKVRMDPAGSGRYLVDIFDEEGEFVSCWTSIEC